MSNKSGTIAAIVFGIAVSIICVWLVFTTTREGYEKLPHSDWYCSDVRMDGLKLPLVAECWEYKRKDSHQNERKQAENGK